MSDRDNTNVGDADNIYRAPASDTRFTPEGDLLSTYIGPKKTEFYAQKFSRFAAGGSSMSWNWPAFFLTSMWLLYRKMWLIALCYWILLPIVLLSLAVVAGQFVGEVETSVFYNASYVLVTFILIPMFANRIYYGHAKRKIAKVERVTTSAEQQSAEVARIGGTSNIVLVIMPVLVVAVIGIFAAIAIPAYQDYTVRAQVSEGLNLSGGAKAAVAEYFLDSGEFAENNEIAGLAPASTISGRYVSGVAVRGSDIVISFGKQSHAILDGKSLLLSAQLNPDDSLQWTCSSPDIMPKHLPAACR